MKLSWEQIIIHCPGRNCSYCRKYMITGVIELLRVVEPVSELAMAAVGCFILCRPCLVNVVPEREQL
jgi:hypothetical protein